MDFKEAMQGAMKGEKIRRKCWTSDCFLFFNSKNEVEFSKGYGVDGFLSIHDMRGENWQIYLEPKKVVHIKLLAYVDHDDGCLFWRKGTYIAHPNIKRCPSEDKVVTIEL